MSRSAQAPPRARGWLGRLVIRTPLWAALVAGLLLLSAAGLAVAGTAGARLLQSYLVTRVDTQLEAVALRARFMAPGFATRAVPGFTARGLPGGVATELIGPSGTVLVDLPALAANGAQVPGVPQFTVAELGAHVGTSVTVQGSAGSAAPWRVYVTSVPAGYLVVAASLADVESTVRQLVVIDLLVGIAVLAGLGLMGYLLVRASLRPLAGMESTAEAIAGGDLSKRVEEGDPRTEVGRLSRALNGMLGQIESAFRARSDSERAARRSEERMRQLVADASHELRTPLTSIRGFAELARQDAAGELDPRALLGHVEDEANRMALLVDDLLLLARLDEQRPLASRPVDLLAVAAAAVQRARILAPERAIDLVVGSPNADGQPVPPGDALVVLGDEDRLRQVVDNLVGNALVHTPASAEVRVRLATTPPPEPTALLQVMDTGPGLRPQDAERVFERFYRVDRARSRASGGTGLGLSIVAAIVQSHGGTVGVANPPTGGAVFTVTLPLADAGPARSGTPAGSASPATRQEPADRPAAAPPGDAARTFSNL